MERNFVNDPMEAIELQVLAPADAEVFLLDRTPHRRPEADDAAQAAAIARELGGLVLALEQAVAYIERFRLSLGGYLRRWETKRSEVVCQHDPRLIQYPAGLAITWEMAYAQLTERQRCLLGVLAWLAPEPVPLFFFDAPPLAEAISEPRDALAALADYALVQLDPAGEAIRVHRLVQKLTRSRRVEIEWSRELQIAVEVVASVAAADPQDVGNQPVWTALAPHVTAVAGHEDAMGRPLLPSSGLIGQLGNYLKAQSQFSEAEHLLRRALTVDEQSLGPDHPEVAAGLNSLADLLAATNRLDEAEPPSRRCLEILLNYACATGREHPDLRTAVENYAGLLEAMGQSAEQVRGRLNELGRPFGFSFGVEDELS
jgi:tetratricopeptide (TPR) repeat protein